MMNTLADEIRRFTPALHLALILPRRLLSFLRVVSFVILFFSAVTAIALAVFLPEFSLIIDLSGALACLMFGIWFLSFMLYCYHNSYYFKGFPSIIGTEDTTANGTTYEVAEVLRRKQEDITDAFLTSPLGSMVMVRSGIDPQALSEFLGGSRQYISVAMVPVKPDTLFTLISLGTYILQQDKVFKEFLKRQGIEETEYLGALHWVIGGHYGEKYTQRWWGKDNLSRTEGIGRDWAYGTTYNLEKFSRDIRTSAVFSTLSRDSAYATEKITTIEHILARAKAANVLLLGEAGVGKMDLLIEVSRRMKHGEGLDAITGKQMIVLDTDRIFASCPDKQTFELTFLTLMTEANKAGNIIIVIENISSFIRQAEGMQVLVAELMDPYLASPNVQIIGTDTPSMHHAYLEPLGAFTRRFEEVLIDTPDLSATIRVLQGVAEGEERRYNTLFTYQALAAITESADRYIVDGVMPDKAISLLIDVATKAKQQAITIITEDFVFTSVSEKTGIPAGPIQEGERELLLHLEDRLHQRVIGQEKAIDAIARTMRRARAGIQKSDRPIGSFLFLGPTGVGKTETAKALALVFFGGEEHMRRIDMSEFSGEDAVARLIGDGEHSGILPDMLQEHPYSVLLLDEFEKAVKGVHDLFLQILDEGVFTSARGTRINARNTIIIATSNAGSQLIIRTLAARKDLAVLEREIIDHIIQAGIFRPELINRFDSTIIFEPLNIEEQGSVASLMLGELYERIRHRGYELTLTRDLIDVLVEKGYDPEFGARPMQRVIQDLIEEKVAQKIISGEAKTGDTISLTRADFSEAELATTI